MIRHLFKLVWNRKGSNLLIVMEIFVSFLVIFSLASSGIYLYSQWSAPLGFDWHDVWTVRVYRNVEDRFQSWDAQAVATFRRLLDAAASLPEVESAAAVDTAPYGGSTTITGLNHGDAETPSEISQVTPELAEVLRLQVAEGRWFQPGDDALDWQPIVIDRELARELVGDSDPLGFRLVDKFGDVEIEMRVVGVLDDYRRQGEFNEDRAYTLALAGLDKPEAAPPLESLVLRLRPGTPAAFEETLARTLQAIGPGWSYTVNHLDAERDEHIKYSLLPLIAVGLVAGFLVLMVVLGLTGVMWQNVTRRTREFGLRRAIGAHRLRIQRQIIGEVAVTAGLGVLAGGILAAQVPLIGPFSFVPWSVVTPALAVSAAIILALAAVCGLYPGWTATRIHPAEALHYE